MAKKSKRTIYNSLSYKKDLKLAFGIDVIVDHIEIHPPSFCKPCKLSMDRVLNASRQNKYAQRPGEEIVSALTRRWEEIVSALTRRYACTHRDLGRR